MKPSERLREWVDDSELTRGDVADHCKVSRQTLHNWISGECSPTVHHATLLEELTGIAVSDWVAGAVERMRREWLSDGGRRDV